MTINQNVKEICAPASLFVCVCVRASYCMLWHIGSGVHCRKVCNSFFRARLLLCW